MGIESIEPSRMVGLSAFALFAMKLWDLTVFNQQNWDSTSN